VEGGRKKEEGGRRKEEGGRRKEEGGRRRRNDLRFGTSQSGSANSGISKSGSLVPSSGTTSTTNSVDIFSLSKYGMPCNHKLKKITVKERRRGRGEGEGRGERGEERGERGGGARELFAYLGSPTTKDSKTKSKTENFRLGSEKTIPTLARAIFVSPPYSEHCEKLTWLENFPEGNSNKFGSKPFSEILWRVVFSVRFENFSEKKNSESGKVHGTKKVKIILAPEICLGSDGSMEREE
jgi:hypothetical protein